MLCAHVSYVSIYIFYATDYRNSAGAGAVILDDCNFHESVHLDNFDLDRTLMLVRGKLFENRKDSFTACS